tara:strand:- start:254 stop:478 length:225 start_codon:yes stop_codon:yes gene_type:complete
MDALGGNGNGELWFAANNAEITNHPYYQEYSQKLIGAIDTNVLKQLIGEMYPSTQAAPIINYLKWVLTTALAVA